MILNERMYISKFSSLSNILSSLSLDPETPMQSQLAQLAVIKQLLLVALNPESTQGLHTKDSTTRDVKDQTSILNSRFVRTSEGFVWLIWGIQPHQLPIKAHTWRHPPSTWGYHSAGEAAPSPSFCRSGLPLQPFLGLPHRSVSSRKHVLAMFQLPPVWSIQGAPKVPE